MIDIYTQMTCLCQKLLAAVSLSSTCIEGFTDSTPNGALSAVTAMADKLSQAKKELQTSEEQLEEVSVFQIVSHNYYMFLLWQS